ncbi:hypothetical protein [Clostridium thermarum]|uniref:hypothetical protein n=1 Tax=Clostridium thermarum TaxID=1716543 RepID=UPI00111F50BA|nr:hypothetical protein [Clostridium thermarum]
MRTVAKPIDVVAWFTKEGEPRPVRFRVTNEEESETVIKVDKILYREIEKLAGNPMLVFRCQGEVNGVEKVYELKYELLTCRWMLFKI